MIRLRDRVTRLRAPLISAGHGNQRRDWANAAEQLYPASVTPVSSTEEVVNTQSTTGRFVLELGPYADLEATDRIRWDGDVYEVDGDVERHKHRSGRLHHLKAMLLRVTVAAG